MASEEKILYKVRKLLDKANDPSIPAEERQVLIDGADRLMIKYEIDSAMLDATLTRSERRKPVSEQFKASDPSLWYWERFRTVLMMIGKLHGVRIAFHYEGDATLVGFYEDVEYVKMKWLNIYLHFSKSIDPIWDMNLTIDHNVYNFKTAGRRWEDIQDVMFGVTGIHKPLHFFKPSYRRHCKLIGEEPRPHTQRNAAYRNSFTIAFINQICARIEAMMSERSAAVSEAGALVHVKDAASQIDEEFYRLFPGRRPLSREEAERLRREREEEHQRYLDGMTKEERTAYEREQERLRRQSAKFDKEYWRNQAKMFDAEGANLGVQSANKVDLNRMGDIDHATHKEL